MFAKHLSTATETSTPIVSAVEGCLCSDQSAAALACGLIFRCRCHITSNISFTGRLPEPCTPQLIQRSLVHSPLTLFPLTTPPLRIRCRSAVPPAVASFSKRLFLFFAGTSRSISSPALVRDASKHSQHPSPRAPSAVQKPFPPSLCNHNCARRTTQQRNCGREHSYADSDELQSSESTSPVGSLLSCLEH